MYPSCFQLSKSTTGGKESIQRFRWTSCPGLGFISTTGGVNHKWGGIDKCYL